jgi:glycosyltransferase involved in cell wall biosynthesis
VARNTPKKAFNKLFEAYFYLLSGAYLHCNECEKISVFPYDLIAHKVSLLKTCCHCHSIHVTLGKMRDDIRLYIHAAIHDSGWNFIDLQDDYDLFGKIYVNNELKIGFGLSEETLNDVYNGFDIFTLPSKGEAFGLPILEAMSAGIPIVVTDYSAYPEWARGCGELVSPIAFEGEPVTNIRRAIINMDEYVSALLKLINDEKLRKEYGAKGREIAQTMDWASICTQWEQVIDHTLSKE